MEIYLCKQFAVTLVEILKSILSFKTAQGIKLAVAQNSNKQLCKRCFLKCVGFFKSCLTAFYNDV